MEIIYWIHDNFYWIFFGVGVLYILWLMLKVYVIERIERAEMLIHKTNMKIDSQRSYILSLIGEEDEKEED
jgi:hypothetical protein|tara:strand:+ start:123 stop:335 length:213 start_codon:yes stop_codon:yes gene_type:complete